ncbi:MAG: type II toxin-antitoxin system prevent-host-death family antitoxin [Pirellulales bacterium]
MASVTAFEAKTRFGELLQRVARGEEVVITRHDKPVARIVPEGGRDIQQGKKAAAGLLALQQSIRKRCGGKPRLSDADVRAAIEEGRA